MANVYTLLVKHYKHQKPKFSYIRSTYSQTVLGGSPFASVTFTKFISLQSTLYFGLHLHFAGHCEEEAKSTQITTRSQATELANLNMAKRRGSTFQRIVRDRQHRSFLNLSVNLSLASIGECPVK